MAAQTRLRTLEREGEEGREEESSVQRWWTSLKEKEAVGEYVLCVLTDDLRHGRHIDGVERRRK